MKKTFDFPGTAVFQWEMLDHQRSVERRDASTCLLQGDGRPTVIVMVGGTSSESLSLSTVEVYDPDRRDWSPFPDMSSRRSGCCAASLGGRIYVFGGVNENNERLDTCESFGRDIQEWSPEPSMPTHRWFGAAFGLPLHGEILVLGGRDSQWQEFSTVQSYNPSSKTWTDRSSMSNRRFGRGVSRISTSKVITVGGFNGRCWMSSAEVYDYDRNEWIDVAPMPEPLEFCNATMLGSSHVVVSGKPRQGHRFKLYCYNIDRDHWTSYRPGCKFHGAVNALAYGSQLLVVDETSDTFLTSNALSVVEDDMSDMQSYGSDPLQSKQSVSSPKPFVSPLRSTLPPQSPSIADDDSVPWWTAAGVASAQQKLETTPLVCSSVDIGTDIGNGDLISCLEEDSSHMEDDSTTADYNMGSQQEGQSPRRRSRLDKVEDVETHDSQGRKVKYTGYISVAHRRPHGKGKMTWFKSGDVYSGSFRHGQLDGFGRMRYANGDSFEGMFSKDVRNGPGLFRFKKDGRTLDCTYKNDAPDDPNGRMTLEDGTIYVGSFIEGKRNGKGIQRFPNGARYEGGFLLGRYHGYGICNFQDGSIYEGEWMKGQAHGRGTLMKGSGEILHDGLWQNDAPVFEDS